MADLKSIKQRFGIIGPVHYWTAPGRFRYSTDISVLVTGESGEWKVSQDHPQPKSASTSHI